MPVMRAIFRIRDLTDFCETVEAGVDPDHTENSSSKTTCSE